MANIPIYGTLVNETTEQTIVNANQVGMAGGGNAESAIGAKAPLASPAFTGEPTAPTPTTGDSSTKIATTAFVHGAVSGAITDAIGGSY